MDVTFAIVKYFDLVNNKILGIIIQVFPGKKDAILIKLIYRYQRVSFYSLYSVVIDVTRCGFDFG